MNIPHKKAYARHLDKLRYHLKDVEHFRTTYTPDAPGANGAERGMNIAVVVLTDGNCYVGIAKQNYRDQYSKSRGHEISMGRALKRAAEDPISDFRVPTKMEGTELRDYCRLRAAAL